MPYQLIHDGLLREFRLFVPIGWPYWVERVFAESGRNGLPLVIALHGGGQDPENFSDDWPFHTLINSPDNANWEDRFFVLYPHGFAATTLAGQPLRGWNAGFTGDIPPAQNDVAFIQEAVGAVENLLRAELEAARIRRAPIDVHRRYAFGYSQGGLMAYKLAHDRPDVLAALWVMSAAFGGRNHEGLTPTITNDPQGSSTLSLFAHHGDPDAVVPPGAAQRPGRPAAERLRPCPLRGRRNDRRRCRRSGRLVPQPRRGDPGVPPLQRLRADGLLVVDDGARYRRRQRLADLRLPALRQSGQPGGHRVPRPRHAAHGIHRLAVAVFHRG
jgi:poly(3-hydroxybutyrate) depolymerase